MRLQFIAVIESESQLQYGHRKRIKGEKRNSVVCVCIRCMHAPCPSSVQMTPIEIRFIQVKFETHSFN